MQEKSGFIYIWYDRKRKMYYIGCHWGTETDGYICSSRRMRDVYRRRPQDFKRRIIQRNISKNMLLSEEHKWLSMISDNELGTKYYNHSKHHFGHWFNDQNKSVLVKEKLSEKQKGKKHTEEWKKAASERMKGNTHTLGKKLSDDQKKKVSEGLKKAYKKGFSPTKGKKIHTEEWKKTLSEKMTGINNPFFGKKHSDEILRKISDSRQQKHKLNKSKSFEGNIIC